MAGTPITYQDAHEYADVDATTMSSHHTLGPNATQAAAGNHRHDGTYATVTHTHPPGVPVEHEHPLYLPIVSDTEPVINSDGAALKDGQLWVDSSRMPVDLQLAAYFWDNYATINQTPASVPAPLSGWAKAVWSVPADGVIFLSMNGRIDSGSGAGAGASIRVYVGWQINDGTIQYDSVAGWGEWYQPIAGRFISSTVGAASFPINKGDQIKFFPMASAATAGVHQIGFPAIRLLFIPDGTYQNIIGAT